MRQTPSGRAVGPLVAALGIAALSTGCSSDDGAAAAPPARDETTVPNLAGLGPAAAVDRLCRAGLSIGKVTDTRHTAAVPRPALVVVRVVGTDPGPGVHVQKGSAIRLRLSVSSNGVVALPNSCQAKPKG